MAYNAKYTIFIEKEDGKEKEWGSYDTINSLETAIKDLNEKGIKYFVYQNY